MLALVTVCVIALDITTDTRALSRGGAAAAEPLLAMEISADGVAIEHDKTNHDKKSHHVKKTNHGPGGMAPSAAQLDAEVDRAQQDNSKSGKASSDAVRSVTNHDTTQTTRIVDIIPASPDAIHAALLETSSDVGARRAVDVKASGASHNHHSSHPKTKFDDDDSDDDSDKGERSDSADEDKVTKAHKVSDDDDDKDDDKDSSDESKPVRRSKKHTLQKKAKKQHKMVVEDDYEAPTDHDGESFAESGDQASDGTEMGSVVQEASTSRLSEFEEETNEAKRAAAEAELDAGVSGDELDEYDEKAKLLQRQEDVARAQAKKERTGRGG